MPCSRSRRITREQALDFVLVEAGGRLVEDQHACAETLSARAIATICWTASE